MVKPNLAHIFSKYVKNCYKRIIKRLIPWKFLFYNNLIYTLKFNEQNLAGHNVTYLSKDLLRFLRTNCYVEYGIPFLLNAFNHTIRIYTLNCNKTNIFIKLIFLIFILWPFKTNLENAWAKSSLSLHTFQKNSFWDFCNLLPDKQEFFSYEMHLRFSSFLFLYN